MTVTQSAVADRCRAAAAASRQVAIAPAATRTRAIVALAEHLDDPGRTERLVAASAEDAAAYREAGGEEPLLCAPQLDERRLRSLAGHCRDVSELPDPVGELISGRRLPNGLSVEERRVPLGVVAWAFHGRPHTAAEAVALCLRAGNATVLKGTEPTRRANALMAALAAQAVESTGLPPEAASFVLATDDEALRELAMQHDTVALLKQRGGHPLHDVLHGVATVPVVYAIEGRCHLYVHEDADADRATAVAVDSKASRPGRCEAIETMLVHERAAAGLLERVLRELHERGVELRLDPRGLEAARAAGVPARAAGDADWDAEYQSLVLAVAVVDSLDHAVEHVGAHGSGHVEAIVCESQDAARAFAARVDAAVVCVNASTRFSDGPGLGLGRDFGSSTQKLPMRGPIAVRDLLTRQYVVEGSGQVRG